MLTLTLTHVHTHVLTNVHTHLQTQKWAEWNDARDRLLLVAGELARQESDIGEAAGGGRSRGAGAACELSAGGEVGGGAWSVCVEEDEVSEDGYRGRVSRLWDACVLEGARGQGRVEEVVARFVTPLPHDLQGLLSCL
jgi:hypothetical protein